MLGVFCYVLPAYLPQMPPTKAQISLLWGFVGYIPICNKNGRNGAEIRRFSFAICPYL